MSEDNSRRERRSARLSISIPIVISGVDADGNNFSETVQTLVVNKHGGKIATPRHLARDTEVLIENPALGVVAKAKVVWWGEQHYPGDLHHAGLQLLEAQNVWGLAFSPDEWSREPGAVATPAPDALPGSEGAGTVDAETHVPSLAGEEITIRLLQELQESADAHAREFQERLKLLTHRVELEFEVDLRAHAAHAKAQEVGALEEEIRVLRESLSASREEIGKLEAKIQELKCSLQATTENPQRPPTPLEEARRQLAALTNSVVESMNRAAEAGLNEYRSFLRKENQESAARQRRGAEENPPAPGGPSRES
jgi:hypothetical protein